MGILAHVDAGKTTLTEALLYRAGAIRRQGRVDHRDTFLDAHPVERQRGITVFSQQAPFRLEDRAFTLIDTPGHVDFAPEMERALAVLDCAVLVVSAVEGVQAHTRTIWNLLQRYGVPALVFINKIDRAGADPARVLAQLGRLPGGACCVPLRGGALDAGETEAVAALDEGLLEAYLSDETPAGGWAAAAQRLVAARALVPCFAGSALTGQGMDALLEGLGAFAPAPAWPQVFSARVYRVDHDEHGARLCHVKVTGGALRAKVPLCYEAKGELLEEKADQVRVYTGGRFDTVQQVEAGAVCAVTGLSAAGPGAVLSAPGAARDALPGAKAPALASVLAVQALLPPGADRSTALRCLRTLADEQPELDVQVQPNTGDILLHVMGTVQLEVLQQVLDQRFGLEVSFGPCRVLYKETVAAPVIGYGHYEPLRHYAEVHLCIAPGPPGSGVQARSQCSLDDLDKNYQHLVRTHILEKQHRGLLTGAPLTDVAITLTAGRAHLKHTEGGDFREATYRAIRQGLEKAENVLLEPYYAFVLEVPAACVGRAMADLQQRAAVFAPPAAQGETMLLEGTAPVSELMDYPPLLAAYTRGAGVLSLRPAGYRPCHNSQAVIAAAGYEKERDLDNPSSSIFCAHGAGYEVKWQDVDAMRHIKV